MRHCINCRRAIPDGTNYCAPCYEEALENYRALYAQYERDLEKWNSATPTERAAAHSRAEYSNLEKWNFILLLVANIFLFAVVFPKLPLEEKLLKMIKLGTIGGSVVLFVFGTLTLGKVGRGIALSLRKGCFYALLCAIGIWLVGLITGINLEEKLDITLVLAVGLVGVVRGILKEIRGENHASGAPTPPPIPKR